MSDNPIVDEYGDVPLDAIAADMSYILFSHTTSEEINESEYHVFYFDVNEHVGSSAVITLDIVDKLFSIEPDLDIYLYDTNDDLAAYSETEGDETEVMVYEFNQVGLWWLTAEAYEGDEVYLYSMYIRIQLQKLLENLNTDNPMVYDPVLIDACETYDPDGHEFYFIGMLMVRISRTLTKMKHCMFLQFEIDSLTNHGQL